MLQLNNKSHFNFFLKEKEKNQGYRGVRGGKKEVREIKKYKLPVAK